MESIVQHWKQGGGGITKLGGVPETAGCDTWCYGLVDMMVLGQRLDTILEVFPTLMIL